MKYNKIKKLSPEDFRRLTGVKPTTFQDMLKVLRDAEQKIRKRGGVKHNICLEDRLLITLEYWREYRTYFHIANSYRISEATAFRYIRWIENTLIKSGEFSLPGRKKLLENDMEFEVIMIDATETPIERPKKNNANSTQAKRNAIR